MGALILRMEYLARRQRKCLSCSQRIWEHFTVADPTRCDSCRLLQGYGVRAIDEGSPRLLTPFDRTGEGGWTTMRQPSYGGPR
jgi:hypothetical protein